MDFLTTAIIRYQRVVDTEGERGTSLIGEHGLIKVACAGIRGIGERGAKIATAGQAGVIRISVVQISKGMRSLCLILVCHNSYVSLVVVGITGVRCAHCWEADSQGTCRSKRCSRIECGCGGRDGFVISGFGVVIRIEVHILHRISGHGLIEGHTDLRSHIAEGEPHTVAKLGLVGLLRVVGRIQVSDITLHQVVLRALDGIGSGLVCGRSGDG